MAHRFTMKIGDHMTKAIQSGITMNRSSPRLRRAMISSREPFPSRLTRHGSVNWSLTCRPRRRPCVSYLACGTGDIAFLLAGRYPTSHIMGIDITKPMLRLAWLRNTTPNVAFIKQDMGCLGVADSSMDIVTGGYALRNAPDLERALEELNRVLKAGGSAAFLDFSRPYGRVSGRLQHWILKAWTGFWGLVLHRNHEVYSYIAESLHRFPDRTRLRRLFEEKGFTVTLTRPHFFGITELLIVRKSLDSGRTSHAY